MPQGLWQRPSRTTSWEDPKPGTRGDVHQATLEQDPMHHLVSTWRHGRQATSITNHGSTSERLSHQMATQTAPVQEDIITRAAAHISGERADAVSMWDPPVFEQCMAIIR